MRSILCAVFNTRIERFHYSFSGKNPTCDVSFTRKQFNQYNFVTISVANEFGGWFIG